MKKNFNRLALSAALVLGLSTASLAQVAFGLHGSLVSPSLSRDDLDSESKLGGGAMLKFFLGPNVAIGGAAKYISTSYTRVGGTGVNTGSEFIGSLIPVTGSLDFYLARGGVRPYIGVEAGPYFQRADFRVNGSEAGSTSITRLGAAPRVGLTFALGSVGIFAEGQYHFIFGSSDVTNVNTTVNNANFENPTKLWGLNVGLIFGLPSGDTSVRRK
jgi:outer membrane protein W